MNVMVNNQWEFVNDVDDLKRVIEENLGREIASCIDEIDLNWKDKYDELNYQYEELEDKNEDLDNECDSLQEEIGNLREEVKQLKREKEEIYDDIIDLLIDEYKEMNKHVNYYRELCEKSHKDFDRYSREKYIGMADETVRLQEKIEKIKKETNEQRR